ncbi:hypothetical protein QE152_g13611 [Popillia japonica]|uniref:Uncharacterized protein n=1 Tax=Popillia japonica TaxID=7064 RepID=A0AAW1LEB1_POPJA
MMLMLALYTLLRVQSDDDHAGNICHLDPAMLRVESQFLPSQHNFEIPTEQSHPYDDIPLAQLVPNAAANLQSTSGPSSSKQK